ncbi:AlwI family type II restriction endonuclease [Treponema sp. C6A8]|uniref:AlwI family type II restriction endonuclease n=1 Tax=Treponema sp. C6A8 TaxID=1410609 RepID=UPI0004871EED|nr:AlwI family type II restriction endonuclease [Treponema sp. C6A8]
MEKLEGLNWEENSGRQSVFDNKPVHPARRLYTYNAHSDENSEIGDLSLEQFSSGMFDRKEAEGDARNDKSTFEFYGFGYVDDETNAIQTTKVGQLILEQNFDNEDFLKQLLKIYFPNHTYKKNQIGKWKIFPMKLLISALEKFESLNRSEIVLLFGCSNNELITNTLNAIAIFKTEYQKLENKQKDAKILCEKLFIKTYGALDNKIESYYDYADAFSRALVYTGLFSVHGPGIAAKIRVAEHAKLKFKLLAEKYDFINPEFKDKREYFSWFGSSDSISLPWDNIENRKLLIQEKINIIEKTQNESDNISAKKIKTELIKISRTLQNIKTESENKILEKNLIKYITSLRENNFIEHLAFTKEVRDEILDRFKLILNDDDMSALWLEVNTWKSLIAIRGKKSVKRNFNIEEDLTPKSFAPGIGNTPDMELYTDEYIILPEVSLMTGIRQWEHEGSSVIDHVFRFIKEHDDKNVFGLFISSSINIRTKWQFFILNKESWIGKPVPVIPMTINMYSEIISFIYDNEIEIPDFINLLIDIHQLSLKSKDFETWFNESEKFIDLWKQKVA